MILRTPGALMLRLHWFGAGHFELITHNDLLSTPLTHTLIRELDELHTKYVDKLLGRRAGEQRAGKVATKSRDTQTRTVR